MLLAACSDSGEEAKAADVKPAAPADPAAPATPAAVKAPEAQGTVDMAKLLKPGALPDKQLGKDDAKVTIVEYASMTCPHCAHFPETTFPELKTKYIDTGKARLSCANSRSIRAPRPASCWRAAPRTIISRWSTCCSSSRRTGSASNNAKDALLQISKLAGFTQESFEACLTDQKLLDDVRSVQKRGADEFKVDSTPTFFINGKTYKGAMSIEEMSAIIDPLL